MDKDDEATEKKGKGGKRTLSIPCLQDGTYKIPKEWPKCYWTRFDKKVDRKKICKKYNLPLLPTTSTRSCLTTLFSAVFRKFFMEFHSKNGDAFSHKKETLSKETFLQKVLLSSWPFQWDTSEQVMLYWLHLLYPAFSTWHFHRPLPFCHIYSYHTFF